MNNKPSLASPISLQFRNKLVALATLGAIVSGCASLTATPEERVTQRAQARWTALVAGQFDKAYQYLSPAYKAAVPADRYRARFGGAASWQNAQVLAASCGPDKCDVKIRVRVKLATGGNLAIDTEVQETWLLDDGQWWLFQAP